MTRTGRHTTTILLDSNLETTGYGLDLESIVERLQEVDPSVITQVVDDLEMNLDVISDSIASTPADWIVLGISSGRMVLPSVQQQARTVGIDQFGIEILRLGTFSCRVTDPAERTDHAVLTVLGAIARGRAFAGSRQPNHKPVSPHGTTLTSLLALPELEYRPIPSIRRRSCRAEAGCQQCVTSCPHNALRIVDDQVRIRKLECTSCGICLSSCPNDAITFPSAMPAEIDNQVKTLLNEDVAGADARGILFVCPNTITNLARQNFDLSAGWHPVELPCLGMLTPQWLLAPLRLGAGAVGLVPCIENCRSGQIDQLRQRVGYCQALLREAWDMPEAVQLAPQNPRGVQLFLADEIQFPGFAFDSEPENAFAYAERSELITDVAAADGAGLAWSLEHLASPVAMVEATDGCTLCGSCAAACPADALRIFDDRETKTTLTFDTRRCVACKQCLPACPESNVLSLRRVTDLPSIERGPVRLQTASLQRCERCGTPITSSKMMERIAEILGDEHTGTMNVISRYCADCRGLAS